MANAQPAPPPNLRPMRPIQRVPFVEEQLPLVGPPLADPNDRPFASAPPTAAAASVAPAAAASPFMPSSVTGAAGTSGLAPPAASMPSFASTLASAAPAAAALVSSPSAAGALGVAASGLGAVAPALGVAASGLGAVAPALGGAGAAVSKIAAEAPAVEALIASPSAATALGVAAPALGAVAPNVAQYANPLLQNIAYQDPTLANADRVAGIGQSHPAEDAQVSGMLQNLAVNTATKKAIEAGINKITTGAFFGAGGPAALAAGVVVNALKIKPAY